MHWPLAQKAFAEGAYEKSLVHFRQVAEVIPYEPSSRFEMARCLARLGEPEEALQALETAVRYGWEDAKRLRETAEFQDLANRAEFSKIVSASEACQAETVRVYAGAKIPKGEPVPLIIYLHGLGCGPRSELPYWSPVADKLGCVVVAPRAPTRIAAMLYGWQRADARDSSSRNFFDLAAAKNRIESAVRAAQAQFKIDSKRMMLAGFSQGGGAALRCFGEQPNRYQGALVVGSLYQSMGSQFWRDAKSANRRVVLIAGEYDPLLSRSRIVADELAEAAVHHQFVLEKGAGHEYPTNHARVLSKAVRFIAEN